MAAWRKGCGEARTRRRRRGDPQADFLEVRTEFVSFLPL